MKPCNDSDVWPRPLKDIAITNIQNFRSLELPHGLEEAPVVHQLDPDHLGGVIFFIFFVVLDLLVQIFELDLEDDDDELHHLLTCVCVALPKVKT